MSHAEHRKDGLGYAVQISRAILRLIGAWPLDEDSSLVQKMIRRGQNFLCYFLFLFILVPGLLRMILKEKSSHARLKMIGPLLNCFMSFLKYSVLLYKARAIRMALREMRDDWQDVGSIEEWETMMSKARIGRRLVLLSALFMYGGGLSYRTILPLSKGTILTPDNATIRALACPSYFFKFDEQVTPFYEIVFALQFFAGFAVYSVTCGACGLAALLVLHLCGQLQILMGSFKRLTEDYNFEETIVGKRLALIVQHHTKIQSFLKQTEDIARSMRVTAGKMMNMSLVTFTGIMKTSMGFFNILRSTIS
ncbi:hypothetical protein KM043_005925 [Ampulex compressa]|nr:hypothetical protein KM043_005925 [Ampulex compressa]